MSFFVYILQNPEGRYYIGQTNDVVSRLLRHNQNKVFWTKNKGPWEVVYTQEFTSRSAAMLEEKRLKSLKSKSAIENLVAQR
jgi:putative endonuclease